MVPTGLIEDRQVQVVSGADLTILHDVSGGSTAQRLGLMVSGGFDMNDDGSPDFMATGNSKANIYSGMTGAILYSYTFSSDSAIFGLQDINGDGNDDFAYVRYNSPDSVLSFRSGADATEFWELEIPGITTSQTAIASVDDLDMDGFRDLILGTSDETVGGGNKKGAIRLISSLTGQVLHTETGVDVDDQLGSSVGSLGDVNGDGIQELFFGTFKDDDGGTDAGSLTLFNWLPAIPTGLPLPHIETFDQLAANAPGATPSEFELPQEWHNPFAYAGNVAAGRHWNISTGQFSSVAGPVSDSTVTSSGTGNYLHIDDNGNDAFIEMLSPFFDLSTATTPRLAFHLHSHNQASGNPFMSQNFLSIDVFDTSTNSYTFNVFGPFGHEAINDWVTRDVDLSAFAGKTVRLRFRANNVNLGSSTNTHNIAIDNFAIYDASKHDVGQASTIGLALFDLAFAKSVIWNSVGVSGPLPASIARGDSLRFSFEGEPNQGVLCFFGPTNPGLTSFGAVGQIDCGLPDANSDGIPEALFVLGDGITPTTFNDLFFKTGAAGNSYVEYVVPQSLPQGEISTFQCLFSTSVGVRLSNAVTLFID